MSEIPFFDCNTMVGRVPAPPPGFFHEPAQLLAEMDRAGIQQALTFHASGQHHSPEDGNRLALEATADSDRLTPCWVGQPHHTGEMPPSEDLVRQMRDAGAGALRLFPTEHQFRLGEWTCGELFDALADSGCPVLMSISHTNWDEIASVLEAHPTLNLIVLDVYYRVDRHAYPLMARFPGLRIETATYCGHREVEKVCERFGADRLVFGTGLPLRDPGAAISRIMYAEVSDDEKAVIASGNLRRLVKWGETDA